eukprot:GHVS01108128.1.p1 GENE.GHVS01108128.1~~GHVS01108128.1.p1  ORF type:complete len:724 (+),score=166.40 GHVS01108128.1:80-2251(+)
MTSAAAAVPNLTSGITKTFTPFCSTQQAPQHIKSSAFFFAETTTASSPLMDTLSSSPTAVSAPPPFYSSFASSCSASPLPSGMRPTPSTCPPTTPPFSSPFPAPPSSPHPSTTTCSCSPRVSHLTDKLASQHTQIGLLHEIIDGLLSFLPSPQGHHEKHRGLQEASSRLAALRAIQDNAASQPRPMSARPVKNNNEVVIQGTATEQRNGDGALRRTKRKAEAASEHLATDVSKHRKHYKAADPIASPLNTAGLPSAIATTTPSDNVSSSPSDLAVSTHSSTASLANLRAPPTACTTSPLPSALNRRPRSPGQYFGRVAPPIATGAAVGGLSDRFASFANVKASFLTGGSAERRKREREGGHRDAGAVEFEGAGENGGTVNARNASGRKLSISARGQQSVVSSRQQQQRPLVGANKTEEAAVVFGRQKTPQRFPLSLPFTPVDTPTGPPRLNTECSHLCSETSGCCDTMVDPPGRRTLMDGGVQNYHKVLLSAPPFTAPKHSPPMVAALEKFICAPFEQQKKRLAVEGTPEEQAESQKNCEEASWVVGQETRVEEQDHYVESGDGVDMFSVFGRPSPLDLAHSFHVEMYWRLQDSEKAKSQVFKTLRANGFDVFAMARGPEASSLFASVLRAEEDKLRQANGKVNWRREPMLEENIKWVNKATGRLANWEDRVMRSDRCFCPTPDPSKKWQWNFTKYKRWAGGADENNELSALVEEESQSQSRL